MNGERKFKDAHLENVKTREDNLREYIIQIECLHIYRKYFMWFYSLSHIHISSL